MDGANSQKQELETIPLWYIQQLDNQLFSM